jgi:hypothetical protein|tara:strand:+ start:98 stop:511 length:414 start_codon:yes stop_codon:yes gene_type:complete
MNKVPSNVDDILSLLGEVDIIKAAMGSFDKSINIALASDKVSDLIGPEGHFYILKKMEMVQASTFALSVELLNIAEKLAATKSQTPMENMEAEKRSEPSEVIHRSQDKKNTPNIENPLVNNVLDYLNERLTTEDGEE